MSWSLPRFIFKPAFRGFNSSTEVSWLHSGNKEMTSNGGDCGGGLGRGWGWECPKNPQIVFSGTVVIPEGFVCFLF